LAAAANIETAAERLRDEFPRLLSGYSPSISREGPAMSPARLLAAFAKGALNDTRGFVETAGAMASGPGTAVLWVGFHDPGVTASALALAARALRAALRAQAPFPVELKRDLAEFQQVCRRRHPDFQARILMVAAKSRNIPVVPVAPGARLWQFGWGSRSRSFFETASDADGFVGVRIADSKALSKTIMRGLGLPTPPAVLVTLPQELPAAAAEVGWPCVVKPLDSNGGRGVSVGVRSLQDLEQSFSHARQFSRSPVLVEAFVPGEDHRLTVVEGSLVATTRREASKITGDGVRTIRELLGALNSRRSANLVASGYLVPIAIDAALSTSLARQDLALDDVPQPGRSVSLRSNANRSSGGVCFNVTDVHPQIREMAEALATTLGLTAAGVDYITRDITLPPVAGNGAFIEVNASPGLAALVVAGIEEAQIGARLLGSRPGRIPMILAVGDRQQEREIATALANAAATLPGLAWLCGTAAGLGALSLDLAQLPPPERTSALLRHRTATRAVIYWSLEDLQAFGAPVDRADLGVIYRASGLPQPWQRVIASSCRRLAVATAPEGIIAALNFAAQT
jgi:cyanophycin synthetase